jgi:hypothetical protein
VQYRIATTSRTEHDDIVMRGLWLVHEERIICERQSVIDLGHRLRGDAVGTDEGQCIGHYGVDHSAHIDDAIRRAMLRHE